MDNQEVDTCHNPHCNNLAQHPKVPYCEDHITDSTSKQWGMERAVKILAAVYEKFVKEGGLDELKDKTLTDIKVADGITMYDCYDAFNSIHMGDWMMYQQYYPY